MTKTNKLVDELRSRGLSLPEKGSGRDGKILNSDLVHVLARYSLSKIKPTTGLLMRMALCECMLAYRIDKLKLSEQEINDKIWSDKSDWVAEEKYNGCRIILTYSPTSGWEAFGRNRSVTDFLPVNYTDKILIDGKKLKDIAPMTCRQNSFLLDCEAITEGFVETKSGSFAGKLNSAVAVLQLNDNESHLVQRTTAPLEIIAFDCLSFVETQINEIYSELKYNLRPEFYMDFEWRRKRLESLKSYDSFPKISFSTQVRYGKKGYMQGVLSRGGEGIILKNNKAFYFPGMNGFRNKNACLKVKRTVTGKLGDEIDVFVSGYTRGDEWDKQALIAGLKLSVLLATDKGEMDEHWLATVSGIPLELRKELSEGAAKLKQEYYGKVVTIDGLGVSTRNRRLSHARINWEVGFRADKTALECVLPESFLDEQMF